jgi:hypothetical protein
MPPAVGTPKRLVVNNMVFVETKVKQAKPLDKDYKLSDEKGMFLLVVKTIFRRVSQLRFEFSQDIFRLPDSVLILRAKIIGTPINAEGKPRLSPELEALIRPMCSA